MAAVISSFVLVGGGGEACDGPARAELKRVLAVVGMSVLALLAWRQLNSACVCWPRPVCALAVPCAL